ncbi:hypothetical protein DAPPUDRAFT_301127 [Daphnia pulex]|uniref:Uncharacterized protein n=1 Tax=Daphnia pulex TaxID=6669 RepID=E9G7D4_DAPPU|nr:hypothetical protein DAPPUDRAFT_301127 [Daphnia pulex]|eukprot:EFX84666.1 hypothetical protein DAPPUDRAFT_301127 [Daphnia pulex]
MTGVSLSGRRSGFIPNSIFINQAVKSTTVVPPLQGTVNKMCGSAACSGTLYEWKIPEESIEMIWEQLLSYLISLDTKADRFGEWKEQKPLLENLFYRFFKLGLKLIELRDCVKNYPSNVDATIKSLIGNRRWIQRHLYLYTLLDYDCLMASTFHYVCRFRSGIQFLVDDFSDISFRFDQILKNFKCGDFLNEHNDLEEFDDTLYMLKPTNCYLYPCTFDNTSSIPKHHWWWF